MSSLHFITNNQAAHESLECFLEKWFRIYKLHVMWLSPYNLSPFVNLLTLFIVHDSCFENLLYPLNFIVLNGVGLPIALCDFEPCGGYRLEPQGWFFNLATFYQ
jgi:hypothetical protein